MLLFPGKKSCDPLSPDYVPSVFSFVPEAVQQKKKANLERYLERQHLKSQRSVAASTLLALKEGSRSTVPGKIEEADAVVDVVPEEPVIKDGSCCTHGTSISTQTDVTGDHMERLERQCQALQTEVHNLREKVEGLTLNETTLSTNDEKVRFYTGLSSYLVFIGLFSHMQEHIRDIQGISKFQQFFMTLMRLRLNLSYQDLGYRFSVHISTISRVFQNCIDICNSILVPALIVWPDRELVRHTLPACFRKQYSKCISIIDCFEVFIERPADLKARAQTWSSYKNHNTAKFLISITPQGTVSQFCVFWLGRTSK